jgi:hypothetical protein
VLGRSRIFKWAMTSRFNHAHRLHGKADTEKYKEKLNNIIPYFESRALSNMKYSDE